MEALSVTCGCGMGTCCCYLVGDGITMEGYASVSAARKRIYLLFLERPRVSSRLSRFFLFSFVWLLHPCCNDVTGEILEA